MSLYDIYSSFVGVPVGVDPIVIGTVFLFLCALLAYGFLEALLEFAFILKRL